MNNNNYSNKDSACDNVFDFIKEDELIFMQIGAFKALQLIIDRYKNEEVFNPDFVKDICSIVKLHDYKKDYDMNFDLSNLDLNYCTKRA